MATVSPTWTRGAVIGTDLAGFSALMDPASPSAMEVGGGCLVQERNPASRCCAERHIVLSGAFYLIDLLVHENQISSSYLCKTEAILIEILEDVFS